jgi:hypothetical protein
LYSVKLSFAPLASVRQQSIHLGVACLSCYPLGLGVVLQSPATVPEFKRGYASFLKKEMIFSKVNCSPLLGQQRRKPFRQSSYPAS